MADCVTCGAWFHYEDGSPDGVWQLGIVGPCTGLPNPFPDANIGEYTVPPWIIFDPALNRIIRPVLNSLGYLGPTVELGAVARALYLNAQTVLPEYGTPADDYRFGCADVAPSGVTCPPGYFFDPVTELCQPYGKIYPIPVIPPTRTLTTGPTGPPPPPPPPPPPIVIPTGQPDPEGDEITRDLCLQMAANTAATIAAIESLGSASAGNPGTTAECCLAVTLAISGVAQAISGILQLLITQYAKATPSLDPVTCTQLTDLMNQLTTVLKGDTPPVNSTPSTPPAFTQPAPYTLANARDDIQAAILLLPNLAQ